MITKQSSIQGRTYTYNDLVYLLARGYSLRYTGGTHALVLKESDCIGFAKLSEYVKVQELALEAESALNELATR